MGSLDPEQIKAQMEADWALEYGVDVNWGEAQAELDPSEKIIQAAGLLGTSDTFPRRIRHHSYWDKKTHRAAPTKDIKPTPAADDAEPTPDASWTAKDRRVVATELDLREINVIGEAPISRKEAAQVIINLVAGAPIQG